MSELRAPKSSSAGYVIVLVGAVVFVAGCFFPYVSFEPRAFAPSLYEMQTMRHTGLGWAGAVLILFTGVTALGVLASLGIRRGETWISGALVVLVAVWTLEQLGFALGASGLWPTKAAGYWVVLVGIGIVAAGTIVVVVRLVGSRVPQRPDSSPPIPRS